MTTKDFKTLLDSYTRAVSIHTANRINILNSIIDAFEKQRKSIKVKD